MLSEEDGTLPAVKLSDSQKAFVKDELLKITSVLKHWQEQYNRKFLPKKPISISAIKKKILDSSLEETFPQIAHAKTLIRSFKEDYVASLGGPIEYIILCSFSAQCISLARSRSQKLSAELNIDADSIYKDLLQDAYTSVCRSMYYFTQSDVQISTPVIKSIKREIERQSHYRYPRFSPMSPQDIQDTYRCRVALIEEPALTVEELAQEVGISSSRAEEMISYMSKKLVRSSQSQSSPSEESFDIVSNLPEDSNPLEDVDNLDTVESLKRIFDQTDQTILSLSKEEKDVLSASVVYNFERGWQSDFAKRYINQSTGKPYTRARIGQLFNSAMEKLREHFSKAA